MNNKMRDRKIVITGGACSGKTTLINELKKKGYCCLGEVARVILSANKSLGIGEIQRLIFEEQIERENLIGGGLVFLDRGLVDNYAYCLHRNHIPDYIRSFEYRERYHGVFILDRLPFQKDGLRTESGDEEAEKIHGILYHTYRKHGYNPIPVPVLPIQDRVNFVLNHVQELKGGVN